MDYICRTRALQSLTRDIAKGKILLSHELQRKEGQWNRMQKSDLIDSLLRGYPLNPTYGVKQDNKLAIIDGVQRLSTIRDFINGKFSLSKALEPVVINGEEKNIAGLKFNKFDDDTKEALISSELQIYELTDYTDKDVREMFRRQNNGTALKPSQKLTAVESAELNSLIYSLCRHPFLSKVVSATQAKRDMDKDVIRELLMLTSASEETPITSFRAKDMGTFIAEYEIDEGKIELIKQALDRLDEAFEDNVKVPKTSVSMICFGMYCVIKDNKDVSRYINWLKEDFLANYDTNDAYKQYCISGTSSNTNVTGRLNYFRNIIQEM